MSDLEVLEPYPNEILYSWLSRMFNWYGFMNNPRSDLRKFNTILFGINSRSINNILIPHNLHELIERINLNDSMYFGSVESLIKRNNIITNINFMFGEKYPSKDIEKAFEFLKRKHKCKLIDMNEVVINGMIVDLLNNPDQMIKKPKKDNRDDFDLPTLEGLHDN